MMGVRERNAELRRRSLLEAADRLARQSGWEDLSVEAITRATGMAKGNFYRYFPSKQALRSALEARRFADVAEQIPAIALSSDPLTGIAGYMAHLVDLVTSSGADGTRRFLELAAQTGEDAGADAFFSYHRLLEVFVTDRALRKKTPVDDLTAVLDALTLGLLAGWAADPHRDEDGHQVHERLEQMNALVLRHSLKPWIRRK
jgi:TetR/AcrR family fatty acid metabolism transcriptional regulator